MDTCLQVQFSVVLHTEVVAPVVVVSSACTHGTFTFAGPFSSALGIGFTGTRGGGVTGTDLCEGVKMYVGAVIGLGMQHS